MSARTASRVRESLDRGTANPTRRAKANDLVAGRSAAPFSRHVERIHAEDVDRVPQCAKRVQGPGTAMWQHISPHVRDVAVGRGGFVCSY